MNTVEACARRDANKDKDGYVFDWDRAARRIKESNCKEAGAGLKNDWEWTGGTIFANGKPVPRSETYTYLASSWCIPELELDGVKEDCFLRESQAPTWDSGTYWPDSALAILNS